MNFCCQLFPFFGWDFSRNWMKVWSRAQLNNSRCIWCFIFFKASFFPSGKRRQRRKENQKEKLVMIRQCRRQSIKKSIVYLMPWRFAMPFVSISSGNWRKTDQQKQTRTGPLTPDSKSFRILLIGLQRRFPRSVVPCVRKCNQLKN